MIRVFDVVAHLGDILPAKALGQSIGNSFGEITVSVLKRCQNGFPFAKILKARHGVK